MRVQSFEKQKGIIVIELLFGEHKRFFEIPIFFFGPLNHIFVCPEIGVGKHSVSDQITLHRAGNFGVVPLIFTGLRKLPAVIQPLRLNFVLTKKQTGQKGDPKENNRFLHVYE
ncbi:MAG: hypothetical protein BWZ06_01426 [Bacteroidetes bacterium ADurb.BinA261]|nr:MAG: hypothetical protein BWZ06_01426 [Bacteroidetes bacterium ADurb.BinA261]